MSKLLISFILIYQTVALISNAQTTQAVQKPPILSELRKPDTTGQVQVIQDPEIDSLMVKYVNDNLARRTVPGFRIRIFSANNQDNGRDRATDTKAKFITSFPGSGVEVYIVYESPDWKVYLGDFRSRTDAFRFKEKISSVFPNVHLVECQVNYNKLLN